MAKRRKIDWEAIEREYRTGHLSIREIARQQGCTHAAIQKRAKRDGWTRDLSNRVRSEIYRKVARKVSKLATKATDEEIVAAESNKGANVLYAHRITLGNVRITLDDLLKLLGDEDIKVAGKAKVVRDISTSLRNIIPLERQAFNLDSTSGDDDAPDSIKVTYYKKS